MIIRRVYSVGLAVKGSSHTGGEGKVDLPAGRCKCVRGISNSRDEESWSVEEGVVAGFG